MKMRVPFVLATFVLGFGASALACSSSDTSSGPGGNEQADGSAATADGGSQSESDSGSQTGADSGSQTGSDSGGAVDASGDAHCPGCGDGGGPMDAGSGGDAGGFGMTCTKAADCPAEFPDCFNFNAKGMHCTKMCATAADCPGGAGGLGCSGMSVCKIP